MKKIFSIIFVFTLFGAAAQEEEPTGEIEDAQIVIEKDKPLTLPKASRSYSKTEVLPVKTEQVAINYRLSAPVFNPEPIEVVPRQKPFSSSFDYESYNNYAALGFGNYISPLVQAFLSKSEQDQEIGLWLNHESFINGPVRKKESAFATTDVSLFGNFDLRNALFKPELTFDRKSFHYYGYDNIAADLFAGILPNITDKTHFNSFSLNPELISSNKNGLNYFIKPQIRYGWLGTSDASFNSEFDFNHQMGIGFEINDRFTGYVNAGYQFIGYKSSFSNNRNIAKITPGVNFEFEKFKGKIGVELAGANDSTESAMKFYVFPDISGQFVFNDQLSLNLLVDGGVIGTSLRNSFDNCWFLEDSLSMKNQIQKINTEFSLAYAINSKLSVEPYLGISSTNQKSLFVVSSSDSSRFALTYDEGDFIQTDMGARIVFTGKSASVSVDMKFSNYKTAEVTEPWYLPASQLEINYNQTFIEKLNVSASLLLMDGITGMSPVSENAVTLGSILDLGLSAQYEINEQWGAFIQGRNLLNQSYERYLNYPVIGLNGKLGFIYRF